MATFNIKYFTPEKTWADKKAIESVNCDEAALLFVQNYGFSKIHLDVHGLYGVFCNGLCLIRFNPGYGG